MSTIHTIPTRPVMRYFGGKWTLAPWIIQFFPKHYTYIEPYGGAASVLLRKPRTKDEIYNDIDGEIVNVFRVLRDPKLSQKLIQLCELTPYAADELELAMKPTRSTLERARRTIFKSASMFSTNGATMRNKGGMKTTGFRRGYRNFQSASMDWAGYPTTLRLIVERIRGVLILNKPAIEVIQKYDHEEALIYVDPPYPHDTRTSDNDYRHEMTQEDHGELSATLRSCKGMIVISGYRNELYDTLYSDWTRHERQSRGQSNKGTKLNTECVWLSPNIKNFQERMF